MVDEELMFYNLARLSVGIYVSINLSFGKGPETVYFYLIISDLIVIISQPISHSFFIDGYIDQSNIQGIMTCMPPCKKLTTEMLLNSFLSNKDVTWVFTCQNLYWKYLHIEL